MFDELKKQIRKALVGRMAVDPERLWFQFLKVPLVHGPGPNPPWLVIGLEGATRDEKAEMQRILESLVKETPDVMAGNVRLRLAA